MLTWDSSLSKGSNWRGENASSFHCPTLRLNGPRHVCGTRELPFRILSFHPPPPPPPPPSRGCRLNRPASSKPCLPALRKKFRFFCVSCGREKLACNNLENLWPCQCLIKKPLLAECFVPSTCEFATVLHQLARSCDSPDSSSSVACLFGLTVQRT